MKKISLLSIIALICSSLHAVEDIKKYCVCLKISTSSTKCDATATFYSKTPPCDATNFHYKDGNGNTQTYICDGAIEVPNNVSCSGGVISGNNDGGGTSFNYKEIFEMKTGNNYKLMIRCNDDSISELYDYTNLIPTSWTDFGVIIVRESDGSIKITLYKLTEGVDITFPLEPETPQVSQTIIASTVNSFCVNSGPITPQPEIFTSPKILFDIYPNPSKGQDIILKLNFENLVQVKPTAIIFNSIGVKVFEKVITDFETIIPKELFVNGIYSLTLKNDFEQETKIFVFSEK